MPNDTECYYGIKVRCTGRFSRKQRAGYYCYQIGKVPLNSFDSFIDYDCSLAFLKNSVASVKV